MPTTNVVFILMRHMVLVILVVFSMMALYIVKIKFSIHPMTLIFGGVLKEFGSNILEHEYKKYSVFPQFYNQKPKISHFFWSCPSVKQSNIQSQILIIDSMHPNISVIK